MIPAKAPSLRRFLCCGLVACAGFAGPAAAAPASDAHRGPAALTPNLAGGQFAKDCGNATAAPIFDAAQMSTGLYGVNNVIAVSDPDIVLIGNQWWMIFATGPGPIRDIEPFSAYLPPGASLATTTTYPSDPNGWHIVGALPNGQGQAVPVAPNPSPLGWDVVAAETPSAFVGPGGATTIFYSGHNAGQTAFQIGQMTNFSNGLATGNANPVMSAEKSWEFTNDLGAVSEQAVEWMPQLNEYIMYYTAGGWWATPPQNKIAFAESTDGINWVHRTKVGFSPKYYNQDFLYNPAYGRYENGAFQGPDFPQRGFSARSGVGAMPQRPPHLYQAGLMK